MPTEKTNLRTIRRATTVLLAASRILTVQAATAGHHGGHHGGRRNQPQGACLPGDFHQHTCTPMDVTLSSTTSPRRTRTSGSTATRSSSTFSS